MNFEEIKELVDENNISDENYIIWTDFERINMTHFRSSAQQIFFNIPFLQHLSKDQNRLEKSQKSIEAILMICTLRMKIALKLKQNECFIILF